MKKLLAFSMMLTLIFSLAACETKAPDRSEITKSHKASAAMQGSGVTQEPDSQEASTDSDATDITAFIVTPPDGWKTIDGSEISDVMDMKIFVSNNDEVNSAVFSPFPLDDWFVDKDSPEQYMLIFSSEAYKEKFEVKGISLPYAKNAVALIGKPVDENTQLRSAIYYINLPGSDDFSVAISIKSMDFDEAIKAWETSLQDIQVK